MTDEPDAGAREGAWHPLADLSGVRRVWSRERLVRFFLPLPEPLALPESYTHTVLRFISSHGDGGREHLQNGGGELQDRIRDFTRDREFGGAIALHRAKDTADDPWGLATLMAWVAHVLPSTGDLGGDPKPDGGSPNGFERDWTIADVLVPFDDTNDEEADVTEAFEYALNLVRWIQRAYVAVRNTEPLTLISRERLPVVVPYVFVPGAALSQPPPLGGGEMHLLALHHNLWATARAEEFTEAETTAYEGALHAVRDERAFLTFVEFRREALVALWRDGDYRACITWAATAAETLLDELLLHMLWEEGLRPEDAVQPFEDFLATRVKQHYHVRLRGVWTLGSATPIGNWYRNVAGVRNRIVHAGMMPTLVEAQKALQVLDELLTFACDRLAERKNLSKYPRTALKLVAESGLRKRGCYSRRLRELSEDPAQPHWDSTYARWRLTQSLVRQDRDFTPRVPDAASSQLMLVRCPGGDTYYCLNDPQTRLAGKVPINGEDLTMEVREGLREVLNRLADQDPDVAVSVDLPRDTYAGTAPKIWLEMYRLVPMAGVMVDGVDLEACRGTAQSAS